jgi:hypothetical protein
LGPERGQWRCREDGRHGAGVRRHLGGDIAQLAGLVTQDDQVALRGDLGVAVERPAAHLGGERSGTLGDRVRARHRQLPPARKRTSHVPGAD